MNHWCQTFSFKADCLYYLSTITEAVFLQNFLFFPIVFNLDISVGGILDGLMGAGEIPKIFALKIFPRQSKKCPGVCSWLQLQSFYIS
jgi:hypothetical protein